MAAVPMTTSGTTAATAPSMAAADADVTATSGTTAAMPTPAAVSTTMASATAASATPVTTATSAMATAAVPAAISDADGWEPYRRWEEGRVQLVQRSSLRGLGVRSVLSNVMLLLKLALIPIERRLITHEHALAIVRIVIPIDPAGGAHIVVHLITREVLHRLLLIGLIGHDVFKAGFPKHPLRLFDRFRLGGFVAIQRRAACQTHRGRYQPKKRCLH